MTQSLAGKPAIVTGAGRGFGRAIALALAGAGIPVGLIGRTKSQLEAVREEIEAAGGKALVVTADVTKPEQIDAAIKAVRDRFGRIAFLVNNAGQAGPYGPIGDVDPMAWWRAQEIHVRAPLLFMAGVIPDMRAAGGGRIINIVSKAGMRQEPNLSSYSIGKATAINLSSHVNGENSKYGIRVFALQPGDAVTELANQTLSDPDAQKWMPQMLEILKQWKASSDPEPVLENCGRVCLELLSGGYDALAGHYLDAEISLDEQVLNEHAAEAAAK
jgi:NAD(P)-dependent dehydrogenase (short-subunit alcohol dehydrogenase family)